MAFDTSQFREFRYGWPVVLASTFGISLGMSPLPFYTIGVFAQPLAEEFGWGIDQIMFGLVPFCIVTVISAPMAGYLSDRYGVRKVALISMLTFAMGMMLFSLNNGSHTLYLFLWGLLSALSAGTLPITFTKAISRWFHEKRGLALGIALVGTGIGGALVHGGGLFDGCTFDAGDFGHHVICSGADAFQCVCGKSGCFECHASAAGLVRHWRALGGDAHISLDDARSVIQLMRDGNSTALTAFRRCRTDLATGLANLVSFYNPSLIVLGGGLSRTPELYDGLQDRVDSQTLPATRGTFSIVQSTLGADCVAMGAGWLVFDECAKPKAAK